MIPIALILYIVVLVSFRSTVREHPYIAFGPVVFIVAVIASLQILPAVGALLYIASVIWAAYDVRKLKVYHYRLSGATNGITAFLGCLLLWIIFFPWVLVNHHKILDGKAELKEKYRKNGRKRAQRDQLDSKGPSPSFVPVMTKETTGQAQSPNVAYIDVVVEEVESEIINDIESLPIVLSRESYSGDTDNHRSDSTRQQKKNLSKTWHHVSRTAAIIFIGIAPILAYIYISKDKQQNAAYPHTFSSGSTNHEQMYFDSNQISANATYEFWRRAHSITSDWWALSGAFADQSNDLDMNLIATLVFLEGAIESLEHLSTQGVDARAVQTIWNVLQCMNSFYSIGREVVDYNYRYGSRLPPEISGRVGAAVFALIIQYGLVQSEYTQTAQTLSVEYGRRFPGGN